MPYKNLLAITALLAMPFVGGVFSSKALAQQPSGNSAAASPTGAKAAPLGKPMRYQPERFGKRANMYYAGVWGVDSLNVRTVEAGEIIRFAYRILDAQKAAQLNDKKSEPALICPRAGVKLVVPSLAKVGKLRQSSAPIAGKAYWMGFSNKGGFVKRGDRVDIVIGNFRADGLVVE